MYVCVVFGTASPTIRSTRAAQSDGTDAPCLRRSRDRWPASCGGVLCLLACGGVCDVPCVEDGVERFCCPRWLLSYVSAMSQIRGAPSAFESTDSGASQCPQGRVWCWQTGEGRRAGIDAPRACLERQSVHRDFGARPLARRRRAHAHISDDAEADEHQSRGVRRTKCWLGLGIVGSIHGFVEGSNQPSTSIDSPGAWKSSHAAAESHYFGCAKRLSPPAFSMSALDGPRRLGALEACGRVRATRAGDRSAGTMPNMKTLTI